MGFTVHSECDEILKEIPVDVLTTVEDCRTSITEDQIQSNENQSESSNSSKLTEDAQDQPTELSFHKSVADQDEINKSEVFTDNSDFNLQSNESESVIPPEAECDYDQAIGIGDEMPEGPSIDATIVNPDISTQVQDYEQSDLWSVDIAVKNSDDKEAMIPEIESPISSSDHTHQEPINESSPISVVEIGNVFNDKELISDSTKDVNDRVFSSDLLRFTHILRSLTLMSRQIPDLAIVPFIGGQIISSFSNSNRHDFMSFATDVCLLNRDDLRESPYSIISLILKKMIDGENDQAIAETIRSLFESEKPSFKPAYGTLPSQKPDTVKHVEHNNDSVYKGDQVNSSLNSIRRKHRAMQYSNEIARQMLDSYYKSRSATSFIEYAESVCKGLTSKNTGYTLQLGKTGHELLLSPNPSSSRHGIEVTTDKLSTKAHSDDPIIQDFLDIADALTTMKIPHVKNQTIKEDSNRGKKPFAGENVSFYEDVVSDSSGSLLVKNKRFDVTFRLLTVAARLLNKGCTKEEVLSELKRYYVKDTVQMREKPPVLQPGQSISSPDMAIFSKQQVHFLSLARKVSRFVEPTTSVSTLERRAVALLSAYQKKGLGDLSYIKDVLIARSGETSEYKVLLEILIFLDQQIDIVKTFEALYSNPVICSEYKKCMKHVHVPLDYGEKITVDDDFRYRTWDENVSLLQQIQHVNLAKETGGSLTAGVVNPESMHEIVRNAFPGRYNSKGEFCKVLRILDQEAIIFKEYETKKLSGCTIVYIPIRRLTINQTYTIVRKAFEKNRTN